MRLGIESQFFLYSNKSVILSVVQWEINPHSERMPSSISQIKSLLPHPKDHSNSRSNSHDKE